MTTAMSALVLLSALVLVTVPGTLLVLATRPELGVVRSVALAPAASLGTLWITATVLELLGLPVAWWLLVPVLVAVCGACVVALRRRGEPLLGPGLLVDRWDALGLAAASLVGIVVVWWGTGGLSAVPPNDDGTHHGLFVARILTTHSIDMAQVAAPDVLSGTGASIFYPLGIHLTASLLPASATSVAVVLNATWLAIAAVGLPFGMFVLARRTFPFARRAAIGAAVMAVAFPQLLVGPTHWGGIALVSGMAMAPGVADAVLGLVVDGLPTTRDAVRAGCWLAVPGVGLAFTHSSEIVTVAVLVVVLGLLGAAEGSLALRWRQGAAGLAAMTVTAMLLSAPWFRLIGSRASVETSPHNDERTVLGSLGYALTQYLGPTPLVFVTIAVSVLGVVVALKRRTGWGWLGLLALVTLLTVAVAQDWPLSHAVTAVWYSEAYRVSLIGVYPAAAFLGLGTWWLARGLRRRLATTPVVSRRVSPALAVAPPLVVVAAPLVVLLAYAARDTAELNFSAVQTDRYGGSLATADARASWRWIAEHSAPGDRVLNQFSDGSGWMYALDGLAPVFPVKAVRPLEGDAGYLFDHAAGIATDPRAQSSARSLHVRYAYAGDRIFPFHDDFGAPLLSVDEMVAGGWTVVFRTPSTVVLAAPTSS